MCEVYDKIEKRGYDNGIAKGIEQGIQKALDVIKLIAMDKLTIEEGAKVLKMDVSELKKHLQ